MVREKNITLVKAVQKSESMGNVGYLWGVDKNILGLEIPQGFSFSSISVMWFSFGAGFRAEANFGTTTGGIMRTLKEDDTPFASLEELKNAYPKLFEVTGDFSVMNP